MRFSEMKNPRRKYLLIIFGFFGFIYLLNPGRNAANFYFYLSVEDIEDVLFVGTNANLTAIHLNYCDYNEVLQDNSRLAIRVPSDLNSQVKILEGGEFFEQKCRLKYSSAIILPYRDRPEQLRNFLLYMHPFLQAQKLHYRIYVVEQADDEPFNRASLLNVGAVQAIRDGYPCLIFHDVDLLPLRSNNIYACTLQPRHMSSNINVFRFNLPYTTIFGGAVAITSKQFIETNGMSNMYFGWGAEDDDFYQRVTASGMQVWRFAPDISEYYMIHHKASNKEYRYGNKALLESAVSRMHTDGVNSLKLNKQTTILHPLFTHIIVDF